MAKIKQIEFVLGFRLVIPAEAGVQSLIQLTAAIQRTCQMGFTLDSCFSGLMLICLGHDAGMTKSLKLDVI